MATTKKATKKTTAKKATARKAPAKKAATRKPAAKTTPLLERDRQTIAQDVSYAVAGLSVEAVSLAKAAIAKIEELRGEVAKTDPKTLVSSLRDDAPAKVEKAVTDARGKLVAELEDAIKAFESTFDTRATEGRKLIADLKKDERVSKFLDQTASTRSQLKAALTSVTKTGQVAVEAGRKPVDNATSQLKGAVTSVRKGTDNAGAQVKGAVTSVRKGADAAVEAAKKQADTATSQVKGAVTSVRKSADTAGDAAEATTEKVDQAS